MTINEFDPLNRAGFEAWALGIDGPWTPRAIKARDGDGYKNEELQYNWNAWTTCIAQQALRAAEPVAIVINNEKDAEGNFINAHVRTSGDFDLEHLPHGLQLYLSATPQKPQHPDEYAIERFAAAMKGKMEKSREKGRGGWDDPQQCSVQLLAVMLCEHVLKGDPIDVANFCMMIHQRGAIAELAEAAKVVFSKVQPVPEATYQQRIQSWMQACFGPEISADKQERNQRFMEESVELVQACGGTEDDAHELVRYVFNRPIGEKAQEVGGVMVTLAALCHAQGLDMAAAGELELAAIWGKIDAIRAKQASKPKGSPLPQAVTTTLVEGVPMNGNTRAVKNPAHPDASITCWCCQRTMTAQQHAEADGNCVFCGNEIELIGTPQ